MLACRQWLSGRIGGSSLSSDLHADRQQFGWQAESRYADSSFLVEVQDFDMPFPEMAYLFQSAFVGMSEHPVLYTYRYLGLYPIRVEMLSTCLELLGVL